MLGNLAGGQSSDYRARVNANVGRQVMKFKAIVEVDLPEDLNKYAEAPRGSQLSYVQALAKIRLTLDLDDALRIYGIQAQTVSVVKAHS